MHNIYVAVLFEKESSQSMTVFKSLDRRKYHIILNILRFTRGFPPHDTNTYLYIYTKQIS